MRMDIIQFQRLLWNIRQTLIREWKLLWKKKLENILKSSSDLLPKYSGHV
jgi:hypothetical protein